MILCEYQFFEPPQLVFWLGFLKNSEIIGFQGRNYFLKASKKKIFKMSLEKLKYGFCKKSWSGKKVRAKVFNWSELHFSEVTSYNPYFDDNDNNFLLLSKALFQAFWRTAICLLKDKLRKISVRRSDSNPGLPDGRPRCEPDNHAHLSLHNLQPSRPRHWVLLGIFAQKVFRKNLNSRYQRVKNQKK